MLLMMVPRRPINLLLSFLGVIFSLLGQAPQNVNTKTYENLNAVLWAQRSAEFAGGATQVYRTAESALLRALNEPTWTAALEQTGDFRTFRPAVILDLDETVLDNSSLRAQLVRDGKSFSDDAWDAWVSQMQALAVPGAVHFLNTAVLSGVDPFYITNRVCKAGEPSDPTVRVLIKLRIPVTSDHLLCKSTPTDTNDKGARRLAVSQTRRILLLIGDDFNDFVTVPPEMNTMAGREELSRVYEPLWGERWFILPNAMYGSWERAIGFDLQKKLDALRP
jgi:5'-nucleotidase (lipoprotein e(P4) family)